LAASSLTNPTAPSVSTQPGETRTTRMPFGAHLLRQALAVIGQCRLRCRVRNGGLRQRQPTLNRRDVNNDARALPQHRRKQRPIQTNRGEQIQIKCALPLTIVQHGEATHRGGRSTDDVYDDIDAGRIDCAPRRRPPCSHRLSPNRLRQNRRQMNRLAPSAPS